MCQITLGKRFGDSGSASSLEIESRYVHASPASSIDITYMYRLPQLPQYRHHLSGETPGMDQSTLPQIPYTRHHLSGETPGMGQHTVQSMSLLPTAHHRLCADHMGRSCTLGYLRTALAINLKRHAYPPCAALIQAAQSCTNNSSPTSKLECVIAVACAVNLPTIWAVNLL